ncbi:MAG: tail fiber domain-containing protein [Bacteroidota bacterium]
MNWNTEGHHNIAVGEYALGSNTEGHHNVGVGDNTLLGNYGSANTALGFYAGINSSLSNGCTFLGTGASTSAWQDNLENATAIGAQAKVTASHSIRLGDDQITSIGGQVDWTSMSDGRFKKQVKQDVKGLDFILQLRPVTYQWDVEKLESFRPKSPRADSLKFSKSDIGQMRFTGFVAQEVEQAAQAVGFDFSGVDKPANESDPYGLRYAEFTVPLVKAVQEQQAMIEQLQVQMLQVQQLLSSIQEENQQLKKEVASLKTDR